jgi:site-specific DNA-methyltransferase (adenine-specific)
VFEGDGKRFAPDPKIQNHKPLGKNNGDMTRVAPTLGWTDCGHDNYRPGITFDPFCGTGTTLAAAQDLGRDGLGVDIDADNAWLARERCGLFLEIEDHTQPVVDVVTELL